MVTETITDPENPANTTAETPMEPFTQERNQQIAESLGFTGQAGGGNVRQFLLDNPHLIDPFEEVRKRFEPEFSADELRKQVPPGVPVDQFLASQIETPTLAQGAEFTPTLQQVQPSELQAPALVAPPALIEGVDPVTGLPEVSVQQGQAPTIGAEAVEGVQAQEVTSQLTAPVDPLVAAQMEVRKEATISGQLENLFGDFESGKVPSWAIGAFNKATEEMGARGITSSTISSGAITQAFLQNAIPIASKEADTYFQADLSNFQAEQQANLVNFQARQQNMLTDTAIENASRQINAASAGQTQQFVASMITSINTANADRLANMEQFNIAQDAATQAANIGNQLQVETFNKQQDLAVQQFNAGVQNDRDKFNANMRFAIDQSNVMWQRSVNTASTAATNAANQANAQNMFNLSTSALNSITQEWRDNAAWAFEASQRQADREYNLAVAAGNREYYSRNDDLNAGIAVGGTAIKILTELPGIAKGFETLSNFLDF